MVTQKMPCAGRMALRYRKSQYLEGLSFCCVDAESHSTVVSLMIATGASLPEDGKTARRVE